MISPERPYGDTRDTGEFLLLMELKEMEKLDNHVFEIACDKLDSILGGSRQHCVISIVTVNFEVKHK